MSTATFHNNPIDYKHLLFQEMRKLGILFTVYFGGTQSSMLRVSSHSRIPVLGLTKFMSTTLPPLSLEKPKRLASEKPGIFGLQSVSDAMPHLDLLRFFASCGIVIHHSLEFLFPVLQRAEVSRQTHGLALFVDFFFVISGFVISFVYHDRVSNLRQYGRFLQRRIGRLVPLHWLTLAISFSCFSLLLFVGHAHIEHAPSFVLWYITLTALLLHGFVKTSLTAFNGVSWSISTEMGMYLLFPAIAMLGRKTRLLPLILSLLILSLICFWLQLNGLGWGFRAQVWTSIFSPLRTLPSFLFGAGLFYSKRGLGRLKMPGFLLIGSLALLVVGMLMNAPALLLLFGTYTVAVFGVAADVRNSTNRWVALFSPLGQLTYSIYMLHGIFIMLLLNAIGDKLLHLHALAMIVLATLCYACILGASYLSFFAVETPARRKIDSWKIF